MYRMGPNLLKVRVIRMYGHDYENGHTCPSCSKTGICCTIEDGFCENGGDCDNCIQERYMQEIDREYWGEPDYE